MSLPSDYPLLPSTFHLSRVGPRSFLSPLDVLIGAECSSCSWHTTRFGYEMSFSSSESYVGVCMRRRGAQTDILTPSIVFHSALVVMAALQVHETRAALVLEASANWTTNYVVRIAVLGVHRLTHGMQYRAAEAPERCGKPSFLSSSSHQSSLEYPCLS